jgi:hypothetical protein
VQHARRAGPNLAANLRRRAACLAALDLRRAVASTAPRCCYRGVGDDEDRGDMRKSVRKIPDSCFWVLAERGLAPSGDSRNESRQRAPSNRPFDANRHVEGQCASRSRRLTSINWRRE